MCFDNNNCSWHLADCDPTAGILLLRQRHPVRLRLRRQQRRWLLLLLNVHHP